VKAVVQRVLRARVLVEGEPVGEVGRGMLVLLGVMKGDGAAQARRLAGRVATFRMFEDDQGRMNLSAQQVGAGALVVSQLTLGADGRSGRRPSFAAAAPPELALPLYQAFNEALGRLGVPTSTGRFGARMLVELVNDGPVTFVLEEAPRALPPGGP
jgi:D-tyrosyl-tRNA(Tyr) deacylase